MSIVLNSAGGGSVTINEPNTASNRTLTLPNNTGNLISSADSGTVTPTMLSQPLTLMTAQTASGSSVNFTGIPSWVSRITVTLRQVSTAAAGTWRLRLGTSSGLVTTGYAAANVTLTDPNAVSYSSFTDGIAGSGTASGTTTLTGTFTLTKIQGSNAWVATGSYIRANDAIGIVSNGHIDLAAVLDRVSVVTTSSTFDAGTINVMYEG